MKITSIFTLVSCVSLVHAWWQPTATPKTWDYQLGAIGIEVDVEVLIVDGFDVSVENVTLAHDAGKKVICYFSTGSWETWRPDADDFPSYVIGNKLDGWAGEKWLDITATDVLEPIMGARFDIAQAKNCDGVDPDNMDGYTQNSGFTISYNDQIVYNSLIAQLAHDRDLAVGLKNDLEQVLDLHTHFDFAVNEECFAWEECCRLAPFIANHKPVFSIEYEENESTTGPPSVFCPIMNAMGISTIEKTYDLYLQPRIDCLESYDAATSLPTSQTTTDCFFYSNPTPQLQSPTPEPTPVGSTFTVVAGGIERAVVSQTRFEISLMCGSESMSVDLCQVITDAETASPFDAHTDFALTHSLTLDAPAVWLRANTQSVFMCAGSVSAPGGFDLCTSAYVSAGVTENMSGLEGFAVSDGSGPGPQILFADDGRTFACGVNLCIVAQ